MQNVSHFTKNNVFSKNAFFWCTTAQKNTVFCCFIILMELCHVCIQLTPNGIPGFIVQGHVGFPGHLPRVKSPWETSPSRGPGGHSLFFPQLFGSLAPWWNLRGCGNGWFRSETGGWNGAEFIQAGGVGTCESHRSDPGMDPNRGEAVQKMGLWGWPIFKPHDQPF